MSKYNFLLGRNKPVTKLKNVSAERVDAVDRPANGWDFLLQKNTDQTAKQVEDAAAELATEVKSAVEVIAEEGNTLTEKAANALNKIAKGLGLDVVFKGAATAIKKVPTKVDSNQNPDSPTSIETLVSRLPMAKDASDEDKKALTSTLCKMLGIPETAEDEPLTKQEAKALIEDVVGKTVKKTIDTILKASDEDEDDEDEDDADPDPEDEDEEDEDSVTKGKGKKKMNGKMVAGKKMKKIAKSRQDEDDDTERKPIQKKLGEGIFESVFFGKQ